MNQIAKCLAANIRNLRKSKGWTQAELASRAGLSEVFLHGIEAQKKWISPPTIQSIAQALQVSENELFEDCFKREKAKASKMTHVPDDIFFALVTICREPGWRWETFRWILQGYQRDVHAPTLKRKAKTKRPKL